LQFVIETDILFFSLNKEKFAVLRQNKTQIFRTHLC